MSPAALERAAKIAASDRWIRPSSTCPRPLTAPRRTRPTTPPAVATYFLMDQQLRWMNSQGGLDGMVEHLSASSAALYGWAEATSYTTPYVSNPDHRSLVVGTIDFDESILPIRWRQSCAPMASSTPSPIASLGRNQLRVAMYPVSIPQMSKP
ncbi:MAG: hypothetical protein R2709_14700 [Marmoricola sp.]